MSRLSVWSAPLFAISVFGSPSCGPAQDASRPAAEPSAAASSEATTPRDELKARLEGLPSPQPVLEAMPETLVARLRDRVEQLTPEQRSALLTPGEPLAFVRPLWHLAAGGRDRAAYRALVSTSAASDELVQLRLPEKDFDDLIDVSNELVRRAARAELQRLTAELSVPSESRAQDEDPDELETLQAIAQAASTLGLSDLELLVLRRLNQYDAGVANQAALALVLAEQGQLAEAEQLQRALLAKQERFEWLDDAVNAARVVAGSRDDGPEGAVGRGRAELVLGNEAGAMKTLESHQALVGHHLGVTTLWIRAQLEDTCPGLLRGNPVLCRTAWARAQKGGTLRPLDAAWASGGGRDAEAVEAFLGLRYVVPMTYRLTPDGQDISGDVFLGYLADLERAAAFAVSVQPYFQGVADFAASLSTAYGSAVESDQPRAVIPKQRREQLLARASRAVVNLGQQRWGQASILAALSLLAQDESVAQQLDGLRPDLQPEFQKAFGALSLWTILADGEPQRFDSLLGLLAEVAQSMPAAGIERTRWLVLWAESEAHLSPGEKTFATLRQMSERLTTADVPLSLRLRAHLNLAGILARRGEFTAAADGLQPVVTDTPRTAVTSQDEQELLVAATGYLFVLRGLAGTGDERKDYAMKLEALLKQVNEKAAAPPTLQMWLALWRGQLETEILKESCRPGQTACVRRAERARGIDRKRLDEALGARTASLLANGVVPIGGVQLDFTYQRGGQLQPLIAIDPRFPLVHSPPLN